MAKAPYMGVYEGMDFGDYEYQHYPLMMRKSSEDPLTKKVTVETRVVENEEEEKEAEGEGFVAPDVGPPANITEAAHTALLDENEALKARLAELEAKGKPASPAKPVPPTPPAKA